MTARHGHVASRGVCSRNMAEAWSSAKCLCCQFPDGVGRTNVLRDLISGGTEGRVRPAFAREGNAANGVATRFR